MSLQSTISIIGLVCSLAFGAAEKRVMLCADAPSRSITADTLPPLNTIREEDIDSADASYKDQTITIKCKNGEVLVYSKTDWKSYVNWSIHTNAEVNKKIQQAVGWLTMTFTKTEVAPAFPGGPTAWDKYMEEYCKNNKKALRKAGEGVIFVQFTVDQHGVLYHVEPIGNPPSAELAALAVDAVSSGPRWIPATQNGTIVVCYHKLLVKLSL